MLITYLFRFINNNYFIYRNKKLQILQLKIFRSIMIPRYPCIRDQQFNNIPEINNESDDHKTWPQSNLNGKQSIFPTEYSEHEPFEELFQFLRKKPVTRNYDISFQDQFMSEHETTFKKQTKNFIESSLNQNADSSKLEKLSYEFQDCQKLQGLSKDHTQQLLLQKRFQFTQEIENQQKIKEFFEFLSKNLSKQVMVELFYIAFICWERYKRIKSPFLKYQQILQQGKKLADEKYENLFNDQRIKFLSLRKFSSTLLKDSEVQKQNFKQYIECFFVTFMLVAQQYFENPFFEDSQCKRQRLFNLEDELNNEEFECANLFSLRGPIKKIH